MSTRYPCTRAGIPDYPERIYDLFYLHHYVIQILQGIDVKFDLKAQSVHDIVVLTQ